MTSKEGANGHVSIREKISIARELYDIHGPALRNDPEVQRLSECLKHKIAASWNIMSEMGVAEACRRCDEEEGGSCCGAGIENRYKPTLLLITLLWGEPLPENRYSDNSCYFLGPTGCALKVRHILCINYLCTRTQRMLPTSDLIHLQNVTGEEMDTVFLLHEAVRRVIA